MTTNADEALAVVGDVNPALRAAGRQLPLLAAKQPTALAQVYAGLDPAVVATCEQARGCLRSAFIEELRKVRDALAPSGRFKEWCAAVGINYSTAKSKIARGEKQSGGAQKHTRSPASKPHLVLRLADDEAKATVVARLRDVLATQGVVAQDDWGQAMGFLLDYWEAHHAREQAA